MACASDCVVISLQVGKSIPAPSLQEQENESDSADEPIDLQEDVSAEPTAPTPPSTTTSATAADMLSDMPTELVADLVLAAADPGEKIDPSTVKFNGKTISDVRSTAAPMIRRTSWPHTT